MRRIAILISIITSGLSILYTPTAVAQKELPALSLRNVANIAYHISSNLRISQSFTDTACINTVIFVRFRVTHNQIDSLYISTNGPVEFKEALRTALLSTNGVWKSSRKEERQFGRKTFLLPVVFYYQVNCYSGKELIKVEKDNSLSILYQNPDIALHTALGKMLDFENGRKITLDCILLNPIMFYAYH